MGNPRKGRNYNRSLVGSFDRGRTIRKKHLRRQVLFFIINFSSIRFFYIRRVSSRNIFKGTVHAGFVAKSALFCNIFHGQGRICKEFCCPCCSLLGDVFDGRHSKFMFEGAAEIGRIVETFLCQIFQGQFLI